MIALIAAMHDGIRDARTGRPLYFRAVLHEPQKCVARLREGLNATARTIVLAPTVNVVYQTLVLKTSYPVEALLIGLQLTFVPYVLMRGPTARAARWWCRDAPAGETR